MRYKIVITKIEEVNDNKRDIFAVDIPPNVDVNILIEKIATIFWGS